MRLAKAQGQLGLDGLSVDDEGDPDACTVCHTRTGRFVTTVVRGEHKIVCRRCAQKGWAPTLEVRAVS